jgi:NADH:ubiquinone oxidoreductase subunit 5 (subunit L)/multisubunit Na+/H+ antiporter MnhA subunit
MLTAFYSMRLINIAFLQSPQGSRLSIENAHEPGFAMTIPLFILAIASILIGYIMKDQIMGPGTPYIEFMEGLTIEAEYIPTWVK